MYIIVGNNTLWGFNICEHLAYHGEKVLHIFYPFQKKRTFLSEYFGEDENKYPSWSIQCQTIGALKKNLIYHIDKYQKLSTQLTVIATGYQQVLILHELKIPFYWWTDGSDISEQPFKLDPLSKSLRHIIQSSVYLKAIISSQRDALLAARLLGRSNILIRIGLPAPLYLRDSNMHYADLINERMTVLSVARRVYSGSKTYSKGTEHIIDFLKLLNKNNLPINLILTASGPDEERFIQDIKSISWNQSSKIKLKIARNFEHKKLINILKKVPKVVALDQFGEKECQISGLIRECIALQVPCITDHMFFPGFCENFDSNVPYLQAHTGEQIFSHVFNLNSDFNRYTSLQVKMKEFSETNFYSSRFVSALQALPSSFH